MKLIIITSLALLVVVRLGIWRNALNQAHGICSQLETAQFRGQSRFRGELAPLANGRVGLSEAQFIEGERFTSFFGDFEMDADLVSPELGVQVEISGPFRCSLTPRNPGRVEDGFFIFKRPRVLVFGKRYRITVVPTAIGWLTCLQVGFNAWLDSLFRTSPKVLGFVRAVWIGDTRGLPDSLTQFYLEGGLMQILALSGQHVAGLLLLLSFVLWPLFRIIARIVGWNRFSRAYRHVHRLLPLGCCGVLWITSNGVAPLKRSFCMAGCYFLLRSRGLECSTVQLTLSSVAAMILWEPDLVCSPSFFLSVVATALLCRVLRDGQWKRQWTEYFFVSTAMPILVFPLTAFFFCKISWAAPLNNLALGWLWDLVLIPIGFALPFLFVLLPVPFRSVVLSWVEKLWDSVVKLHQPLQEIVSSTYRSCPRPTLLEFFALEFLLLFLVLRLRRFR